MWTVEFLNKKTVDEMQEQPKDIRARFEHIIRLIEASGLEHIREPYIKHLEGKLWEMRMKGKDSIARAIYITTVGKRIVILRVFTKNTQKTPRREMKLALERAKDITP